MDRYSPEARLRRKDYPQQYWQMAASDETHSDAKFELALWQARARQEFSNLRSIYQRGRLPESVLHDKLQDVVEGFAYDLAVSEANYCISLALSSELVLKEYDVAVSPLINEVRSAWIESASPLLFGLLKDNNQFMAISGAFARVRTDLAVRLQARTAGEARSSDPVVIPDTFQLLDSPPDAMKRAPKANESSARAVPAGETLGQKVDRLRLDKGMSIEKLALEAGVDKKTVLRITHKGKRATPATLKKLADALGVAASSLAN